MSLQIYHSRRRASAAVLVLLSTLGATVVQAAPAQPASSSDECSLSTAEAVWAQRLVDDWDVITTQILGLPESPLPWTILYDARCTWHLHADPAEPLNAWPVTSSVTYHRQLVDIRAARHGDSVALPGDGKIPVEPRAFTSLYSVDDAAKRPFFVLAMPSLWHTQWPKEHRLEDFFLGVAAHEMTHTLQMVAVERQIESLEKRYKLPEDLSDTTPETHFGKVPGYDAALKKERGLFLDAAAAPDLDLRRELAGKALAALHQRRQRFFTRPDGTEGGWGQLEDIFLGLEGAAVWTHFKLAERRADIVFIPEHPEVLSRSGVLLAMRQKGSGEWVQDEGFLIYLLIDDFVPDWRYAAFGPHPPSPIQLLEKALRPH